VNISEIDNTEAKSVSSFESNSVSGKMKIDKNENSPSDYDYNIDFDVKLTGKALADVDIERIGIFSRKVTYHAPIKKIAEKSGKIALNMIVNRAGKVVGVAVNKDRSTITDRKLLIKAMKMSAEYRFEEDYTAPLVQYCRFTFIFDLPN
jgi:hypothetical protein